MKLCYNSTHNDNARVREVGGKNGKTDKERYMDNLDIVVHETDEGGYWAEIPAMPGCITEGDSLEETKANIREAAEVWLATKLEWILTRVNGQEYASHW